MKYADMSARMYVIRTRELPKLKRFSGVIFTVIAVEVDSVILQVTEDCVPVGKPFRFGADLDDGFWYDVSFLVLEANSTIAPTLDACAFSCITEANYRNFLGLTDEPALTPESCCGNICLLGEQTEGGRIVFGRVGYFVIECDDNGYMLAYQGYCEPTSTEGKVRLVVLNLQGTGRSLYLAEPIVAKCHKAYLEDCDLANTYMSNIRETTADASTQFGSSAFFDRHDIHDGVEQINLSGR